MSTIQAIEAAGLSGDLEILFGQFFKKEDAKAKSSLKAVIDKHGLQSPEVIREVGALQRSEVLEPGIYKQFKDLSAKLAGGGNGQTEKSAPAPAESKKEEVKAKAEPEEAEVEPEVEVEASDGIALTSSDEEDIRQTLQKDEDKWRARLATRERKLREQKRKKNTKKAQRLGLKAEEAVAIKDMKDKIVVIQAENKELKATLKENNGKIKVMRDEIATIRPKKAKANTTTTGGGKTTTKASKVDEDELKAAVTIITDFLKETPGSKSKTIKDTTGVDGVLYNAAISSMKEAGVVEQKGRGPFTNYILC